MIFKADNIGDMKNGYFCVFPSNSEPLSSSKDYEEDKNHEENDKADLE